MNIANQAQYDTRGLRIAVFDIIQEKCLRTYSKDRAMRNNAGFPPSSSDISYLVENMPARARLLDMVVAFHRRSNCKAVAHSLLWYERLPASFLASVHVETIKYMTASNCDTCAKGREHTKDRGHTANDRLTARQLIEDDPCRYHEHGDDTDESVLCARAWEARLDELMAEEEEE